MALQTLTLKGLTDYFEAVAALMTEPPVVYYGWKSEMNVPSRVYPNISFLPGTPDSTIPQSDLMIGRAWETHNIIIRGCIKYTKAEQATNDFQTQVDEAMAMLYEFIRIAFAPANARFIHLVQSYDASVYKMKEEGNDLTVQAAITLRVRVLAAVMSYETITPTLPPTPVTYATTAQLDAEIALREAGDAALQAQIDAIDISGLEADIAEIASDLTAEETARSSADTTLQTNITNEAATRAAADTAEAAARISGDAATLSSANTYADGKVADAINDGITTIAPSQNAVFDALATKENTANKDASGGYVGLSGWSIKFRNLANTFTSLLQNAATAARTYIFPDKDGTVAMLDDLVGVYITARNNTGSTISKGKAVYISGAVGQNPTIALAKANAETTSFSIGVSAFDIPNNTNVQNNVIIAGLVDDIDTSAFSDGDKVYLSSSTAGELQNTAPSSPNFGALVGFCLYSHAVHGKLLIAPDDTVISQNTALGTSRIVVPSENAVKTYADTKTTLAAVNAQKLSVFAATTSAELAGVISDETGAGTFVLGSDSGFATYSGAIAWTGTTAPSGATAHQYRWVRNGNMVTLSVLLSYATVGTANTKVICDLPSGAPTPAKWSSTTALTDFMYMGSGGLSASKAETTGSGRNSGLAINTASTSAFDLIIQHASTNAKTAWITVQYYV